MLTWEQMLTKTTVNRLHPEVLRRFHALIARRLRRPACRSGSAPAGGCSRSATGRVRHTRATRGTSPVRCNPASPTALAIDTVPNISWDWMHAHCGAYGLRTFQYVNNEPWHVQPAEISTSRKFATTLPALVTWELPGEGDDDMPLSDDDIDTDRRRRVGAVQGGHG